MATSGAEQASTEAAPVPLSDASSEVKPAAPSDVPVAESLVAGAASTDPVPEQAAATEPKAPDALSVSTGHDLEAVSSEQAPPEQVITGKVDTLDEKSVQMFVDKLKSAIALPNYHPATMYKDEEHDPYLREFCANPDMRKLIIWLDPVLGLRIDVNIPHIRMDAFMYFIRTGSLPASLKDGASEFTERAQDLHVQYGLVSGNGLESFLRLMSGVFVPLVLENRDWPDSIRKEFAGQVHKFMAVLTDTAHQMKGHTVLYVPPTTDDLAHHPEVAARDKDTVQQLEALVVHWTRQIKEVINNQHTSETAESSGLLEEIEYWRSRCDDLSGISQQLNRPEVQQILAVLTVAKSSYLEQFLRLSNLIQEGSLQARDNLKFLSTLTDVCLRLASAEPKEIEKLLEPLLQRIRLIWTYSDYYKSKERMTSLLRKVSNEIIRRCSAKISLEEILDGDVDVSIVSLQESISCGENWKTVYRRMCAHIHRHTAKTWDFDQNSIFAQIDAFVQRCRDLLEVCEGQIQFARKVQGSTKAPIPAFGGSRGPEIAKSLEDIEVVFEKQIQALREVKDGILDVKATRWHDDYNAFKQGVKDLEVMMVNIITSAFDDVPSLEAYFDLLEVTHHLAKREAIKRAVAKRIDDGYRRFLAEISAVKADFERNRKTPELNRLHPDFAGSAFWARSMHKRVTGLMKLIDGAYFLPENDKIKECRRQYEELASSLDEYITRTHNDWKASIEGLGMKRLEGALLVRKSDNTLEMRFDKDLLRLFSEIHYWQKLKFDIPFHVQEIAHRQEDLRVLRERVLLVVRDYNAIWDALNHDERLLFRERIKFLDRKIAPGLTTLTWTAKGTTELFVSEVRKHAHELQKMVWEFKDSNVKIQRSCKLIADTLLVHIEPKRVYTLEEFDQAQNAHRALVKEKMLRAHGTIQQTLLSTYEVFRDAGKDIQLQWSRYIQRIDKSVEEALRTTVRQSLQEISKAISGETKAREGAVEVQPLFKLNVVLDGSTPPKVDFGPTLQKLGEMMQVVAKELVDAISVIPRFSETLEGEWRQFVTPSAERMDEIIRKEDEIVKTFVTIQNALRNIVTKCDSYVSLWDTYKDIWQLNKDAFMRRYKKTLALEAVDSDIARYNELSNNTQKEETITNISFIRLDCSPLKATLLGHCNAWQAKLTEVLNASAAKDLNMLHQMFAENTARLRAPPTDLEKLSESLKLLKKLQGELGDMEAKFQPIHEQYQILDKYDVPIKEEERRQLDTLHSSWAYFQQTMADAERSLQEDKAKFKAELLSSVEEFNKSVQIMREEFLNKGPTEADYGSDKALEAIDEYQQVVKDLYEQERTLQQGLSVFSIEQLPSKDLEATSQELQLLTDLWKLSDEWTEDWNQAKDTQFRSNRCRCHRCDGYKESEPFRQDRQG